MPFDMAILDDFVPMDHKQVQPVSAKALKIYDAEGAEIPGWHHVVHGTTGATLRVCPEGYSLIQNDLAIDTIEAALRASRLDLTDARFGCDYSHDGARMFAQWIMPAHTAKVRQGVEASLRVVLLNAYDGSTSLSCRVGAFNWVCANTSVSGKEFASFKFRHSGKIDLEPAVRRLAQAAEEHVEQVRRWERWPAIAVTDVQARAAVSALPRVTEAMVDGLVHAWLKARDEDPLQGGANLWCLYNVLTAWASRDPTGGANRAFRNWERTEKVAALVESKLWTELATA